MKQAFFFLALSGVSACVAVADDVQSVSAALDAGLAEQLSILSSVKDTASAASSAAALAANFEKLRSLNDRVDTTLLWRHIENTPEVKSKLLLCIQKISIEYHRIEQARYFDCEEFEALLSPLLTPAAARPDELFEEP